MARKRSQAEEIISRLPEARGLLAEGVMAPKTAKAINIHEQAYYRWRQEHGGLALNALLRKTTCNLMLGKVTLQEAARGSFLRPERSRTCVSKVGQQLGVYQR